MPCADVNSSRLSASKVLALAGAYVGSWHKADMQVVSLNVSFRG